MRLMRHDDHESVWMACPRSTLYNHTQLETLNRTFLNPPAEHLYKPLCRARSNDSPLDTMSTLENISKRFDPFQRIQRAQT